jgi:hypothetical protein
MTALKAAQKIRQVPVVNEGKPTRNHGAGNVYHMEHASPDGSRDLVFKICGEIDLELVTISFHFNDDDDQGLISSSCSESRATI